jgi:hypothetical protein
MGRGMGIGRGMRGGLSGLDVEGICWGMVLES